MKKFGLPMVQLGLTVVVTWFIFDRIGVDLGANPSQTVGLQILLVFHLVPAS